VDEEVKRLGGVTSSSQSYLSASVSENPRVPKQKFKLRLDIARMLKNVRILLRVLMTPGEPRDDKVPSAQARAGLAPVQVSNTQPTTPLVLNPDDGRLPLGTTATVIGFPIPDLCDRILNQKQLTVTQGNVSSPRDDVWGIQQTAAIDPDNSGEPLLDEHGAFVGINAALITNANGLILAIHLYHINQFFQNRGHFDVRHSHQGLSAKSPQTASLAQRTVGDAVILNSEKGAGVFEDDKGMGVVLLILALTKPTTLLRFRCAPDEFSIVLNKNLIISQTMRVKVPLEPGQRTPKLTFMTLWLSTGLLAGRPLHHALSRRKTPDTDQPGRKRVGRSEHLAGPLRNDQVGQCCDGVSLLYDYDFACGWVVRRFLLKRIITFCFLSLLALPWVSAEDWAAVPQGMGRIIVYGDFVAFDLSDLQVQVDNEKSFLVKITQKNVVLDLSPGRHYINLSYGLLNGKSAVQDAGFFLAEGTVAYLQYFMSGGDYWLHLVSPKKFGASAKSRPAQRDPLAGGNQ